MVSTADREYKETKKIILKKKNLNPRFQKLKDYISKEFLVDVANICVDVCKTYKRKDNRIQIILKTNKDCEKFINHQYKNGVLNFFDTENNKKIYDEIMTNHKDIIKFPDLKTFIVYSSFEQLAVEELYNSIPSKVIKELKKECGEEIWEVKNFLSLICIMCYKNNQINLCKDKYKSKIQKTIYQELKKNDFYDFITDYNQINIKFDSKENFDANYEGSFLLYKLNCCVDFL
ncbi:MAG: hypothetical protein K6E22_00165 [Treponema sp.]|nr:hypothetical protein [Treponema sp.]